MNIITYTQMKKISSVLISVMFFLIQLPAFSGGPLEVRKGKALSYGKRPFVYRYDKGNLGKLTNEEAVALVEGIFDIWGSVPTALIRFKKDNPSFLDFDVTADNFKPILQPRTDKDLNRFTPIVFDEDGSLLDAYLGVGASNSAIGIGGPVVLKIHNRFSIPESQIVLNGKLINGIDTGSDREITMELLKKTILHEVGHAIGLDHSQINDEAIQPQTSREIKDSVPVMFPTGVNELLELKQDDISSLSFLYPNKSELTKFGKIEGKVFRSDGKTPVLGANVVLRSTSDPLNTAISCVSDFLANKTGSYVFFAVPPGDYTIEIEPINEELVRTAPSRPSVGPYTKNPNDESFKNPVPRGFYTGPNQLVTNNPEEALTITIQADQVIKDANIIADVKE
jgi:hypothetical protein